MEDQTMTFVHTLGPKARRGVALLVALLASGLALAPAAQASGPRGAFDREFMTEMVSHHGMAVEMAELAVDKATHPELKRVAEDIVRTQTAEIKRMQRWLRSWYGVRVRPRMTEQDMRDMRELEGATGAAFELRFMALMTVHHALAVERAGIAARRAGHAQLRRLARAIVRAQEREIDQFRDWTVAWYAS
jgi:uncharacterized protein (DUF305 family)